MLDVIREVRARIQRHPDPEMKMGLEATYLLGARASEIVGYASKSDTTTPYGPTGEDVWEDVYLSGVNATPEPVAIFRLKTAKRYGMERYIALPLNPAYEPWARPLFEYFRKKRGRHVFTFTRQTLYNHAREVLKGLTYTIEPYYCMDTKERIGRHEKGAAVHFLRHMRATELAFHYGLDKEERAAYCGWTLKSAGITGSQLRYMHVYWQGYFPKLLKPCAYAVQ